MWASLLVSLYKIAVEQVNKAAGTVMTYSTYVCHLSSEPSARELVLRSIRVSLFRVTSA